jgi:hypothetical protein
MCTAILELVDAEGAGKGGEGWFDVNRAVVTYDHPRHALLEEAIGIDFVNYDRGPGARAAVELTLESAKALNEALTRAIAAAEIEESGRMRTR